MIFQHTQYRTFLFAYIHGLPRKGFGEARKIAAHLRVSSTYVSHVLAGKKQLSLEQTVALSRYLGLGQLESEYFFYLVEEERAGTPELRKFCQEKLSELKSNSLKLTNRVGEKKILSDIEKSVFYAHPAYTMAHIFCSTEKNGRSMEEVCDRFGLSRNRVGEILRFLVEAGLCTEHKGRYSVTSQGTHLEEDSPHLIKHHTNWRLRALQAAENLTAQELMYTVNVTLSEKDFEHLREEMALFIKTFLKRVYDSPAEKMATFNLDWFWIRK